MTALPFEDGSYDVVVSSEAVHNVKGRAGREKAIEEAAESLGTSRATAYRHWTFARAWLLQELAGDEPG